MNSARHNGLQRHNFYRRRHRVGNLFFDRNLENIAQNYAKNLASTNRFEHSNVKSLGENLYIECSTMNQSVKGKKLNQQKK